MAIAVSPRCIKGDAIERAMAVLAFNGGLFGTAREAVFAGHALLLSNLLVWQATSFVAS